MAGFALALSFFTTRWQRDIRGKCVGFIVAYDRHLNLVLLDVTETFAAVTHVSRADLAAAAPNEYAGKWPGRPRARRLYCVSQTQTRHLSQLLIRGDAVVSVAMLTPARGTETDPAVPPRGTTPPAAAVSAPPAVPLEPASKPPAAPIAPPAFSWCAAGFSRRSDSLFFFTLFVTQSGPASSSSNR